MRADSVQVSKTKIIKEEHKGRFLRKCPGTPGYLCCNYYVLNIQTNCKLDCHYCILQSYINNNQITIYTNLEDAFIEVEKFLIARNDRFFRIGTGELSDSLCLEEDMQINRELIKFFSRFPNVLFELKTKTVNIEGLLKTYGKNTVFAWSLNPQPIIEKYEDKTASLKDRLKAARECAKAGFYTAFHFDPVILEPEWEGLYREAVCELFRWIPKESIVWISVACFRYTPSLKQVIQQRFPSTDLLNGEFIKCPDGKYRYIRPIRQEVYRKMIKWITDYYPSAPVYFCMESPTMWEQIFGVLPTKIHRISYIFRYEFPPFMK